MANSGSFTSTNQPAKRGRPKGSTNRITDQFRQDGQKLLKKLMGQALGGDMEAAKIVAQFIPRPKPVSAYVTFEQGATPIDQYQIVWRDMAQGKIPVSIGADLIRGVVAGLEINEIADVIARLEALESGAKVTGRRPAIT